MAKKFDAGAYDPNAKSPYVGYQRGLHAALQVVKDKESKKAIRAHISAHKNEFGSLRNPKKGPDAGGSPVTAKPKNPKPSPSTKAGK